MSDLGFTQDDILDRMNGDITSEASQLEGSFTADNLQAVSNELARIHALSLDNILDSAFRTTAEGEYLDKLCLDDNIQRRAASQAEAVVTIEGRAGTYSGVRVAADDIIFLLGSFTIGASGSANVYATCETAGVIGNVPAGAINTILIESDPFGNLASVTNAEAAYGGYDEESDDDLRSRDLEKIRNPGTSGNIYDYKRWTLEVSGVKKARVFPLAYGNGTVGIAVVADGYQRAGPALLKRVSDYIEDRRPIGASVTVESAVSVNMNVDLTVRLLDGYTLDMIRPQFEEKLTDYLKDVTFSNEYKYPDDFIPDAVSYIKVADQCLSCEGISDVTSCRLNGAMESIALNPDEFPVMGEVTLTEASG